MCRLPGVRRLELVRLFTGLRYTGARSEMIQTGLCSVTFRRLDPAAIVALTQQAGLGAIEWGGDIHVPPGDEKMARVVGRMTLDAGLRLPSYGSYYRVGQAPESFADVLASAVALSVRQSSVSGQA
jgi:hypothetical protein